MVVERWWWWWKGGGGEKMVVKTLRKHSKNIHHKNGLKTSSDTTF